jgi:hypothetical protein
MTWPPEAVAQNSHVLWYRTYWQQYRLIPFPHFCGNSCVADHKFLIMAVELVCGIVLVKHTIKSKG